MARSSSTNWRQKYERQWKQFQKNIGIAKERGYTVPWEISSIQHARGGYKQAYERLKRYSLPQIQRESKFYTPEGIIPGGRAMAQARIRKPSEGTLKEYYQTQRERYRDWQIDVDQRYRKTQREIQAISQDEVEEFEERDSEHVRELQQLYSDTIEGIIGEPPAKVPEYFGWTDSAQVIADVQNYLDKYQAQQAMAWEDTADTILYNVKDTVRNFQNPYLAYKVMDKLKQAESSDREGLVERLTGASNEVLTELQRASTYMYTGEIDENGYDDSSLFYGWWTEFLTGTYDPDYEEEYEEY